MADAFHTLSLSASSVSMVSSKEGGAGEAPPPPPPPNSSTSPPPPPFPQDIANNYNYEVYPPLAVALWHQLPPKMKFLDETLVSVCFQSQFRSLYNIMAPCTVSDN